MDLLKSQFDRIQQQVSGLTASQKMLAACLVAIMVMTLVWWGRVAGTSEMEPVVGTPLTPDNVSQIKAKLTASAIPHQVAGDKVLVPAARKLEALAELAVAGALPENADVGLDAIIRT
jgi:flagellar biosynthesis/type III secretory pathway M-ring protein FliF/YscJ